ncbi:MAG: hypothetical protein KDC48_01910 [Planctomycetes bacterium]|nr:hypothetical protein [Planctomycetota bacterium]
MTKARTRLASLLATLSRHHGRTPAPPGDAWQLILRENVVYLVDDPVRDRAMAALQQATGLDARKLARCPDEVLLQACSLGRMAAQQVRKLRECAALFAEVGDPRDLVQLPRPAAKKALKRFPGIGDPGVDMLRLLSGVEPVLAMDSNALRVLLRLGYGLEAKAYSTSYRSAQQAAMAELPADVTALQKAYAVLRRHGKELCRNTAPLCHECPVRGDCPAAS